jgi:RNA polymerase sigma factor (sigma-70 family)
MQVEDLGNLPPRHLYEQLLSTLNYRLIIEKIARKNTHEATLSWEDAAQTAYEKIMLAIQSNKFQYGSVKEFYRWSATIAHCTIIDLMRRENARRHSSLDVMITDTNTPLVETIADRSNLWEAIEQAELLLKVTTAIQNLDDQYPERGYLKLWQAKIQGKKQTQLAQELNVQQGTVSKRWKELTQVVMMTLELTSSQAIHQL